MNLANILMDEILPRVEKPSRYLGTEVNAVHKDMKDVEVRMALAFPDLYDIGLGNLGIHILYACVNNLPWARCERLYAPGLDMEQQLRERDLPLFVLESKDSVDQMDMVGFTLQSELTYTNILNILNLSGIPLRTKDRDDSHPLTCAGGPAVFNPEPIAPFIDFFVIGDGEAVIVEIAEVLRRTKGGGRAEKLVELAKLPGIYVPVLYPFETLEDGRILPAVDAPKIVKRITPDLNGSTFPVDYIVPYTKQVHDRISLEVLRGCTQGCRFCQAGMVTRPVRERTIESVTDLMERTLKTTGYEEVSLVSLSTCDHSQVKKLVDETVQIAREKRVSVSLPSLRLDSYSVELADMVAETRRTGLTVAPEAASPRLRSVINKWIPDEGLLDMSNGAFKRGWGHVKLYFMIGLPTERDDDIVAIADLALRTVREGKEHNPRAKVNLGVSTFVPKPFTPFQWAQQIPPSEIKRKQAVLRAGLNRHGDIKFGRHDPEETFLEGLVSRADRRGGDLIEAAYKNGCRFDAWSEHLRYDLWVKAIDDIGYDVMDALRERDPDERLPWDHIDVLVDKSWLKADWERAKRLEHAPDCRHRKCHSCGVIDHVRPLCASMLRDAVKGRIPEAAFVTTPRSKFVEPQVIQRLWFRISRTKPANFLSHLESMNTWMRALRRCEAPLSYSQGFHPHPKMAFSAALPLGQQSMGEYLDITLHRRTDPQELLMALSKTLPLGFGVHAVSEVDLREKSLMVTNQGAEYTLVFPEADRAELSAKITELNEADEILVARKGKTRKGKGRKRLKVMRELNIRPMITKLVLREGTGACVVELSVVTVDTKPGKAREVVALLSDNADLVQVLKRDTLAFRDGNWESISASWGNETPDVAEVPAVSAPSA
ncbi:MAG: TIGR03960 family B12-binding radical SAM protein [Rhodobacterales bacterium]|nr:TIGR03960 family B12-binding radical SAM protein [Rhodobacterales bacterium]